MLIICGTPQWISEQLLYVFINIVISTYMSSAYDVPNKILHSCDHHQKNYNSHDNISNEENGAKCMTSNGGEIIYHNNDENEIEKSGLLHDNFLLDDIHRCYKNVTVLYLAGYDDEIFELRHDLLKKGKGNELIIYFFLYRDNKFLNIGKIYTNIIYFNEIILKYTHYYYLDTETVNNNCSFNKLRFENLVDNVPDEAIYENKSNYFTIYPQKENDGYEFVIPKEQDMIMKDIMVHLNKNKDDKLNESADSTSIFTSSLLDHPNDNEVYYIDEDSLNPCTHSKYLKLKDEEKYLKKNETLKSHMEISPAIELESKGEDFFDEYSKSILSNTKRVQVPCNNDKEEQTIENLLTSVPVTSTVMNSKPNDTEKTREAKIFKDKSIKNFQNHKDTTYNRLPKMLNFYTKTRNDQVYSYKNPFNNVNVKGFDIVAPILFQGKRIDKNINDDNRVRPNNNQYYVQEKLFNDLLSNAEYDINKPNYKAFSHIHTSNQYIPNKRLPTKVESKNTDLNFHTQIKNIPFFKPLSSFSDGSCKIKDKIFVSNKPYDNNYIFHPNYVIYKENLKSLENKKYSTKNPLVDFSIPVITSSANIKINDKNKKIASLPKAYSVYYRNSAYQEKRKNKKYKPNKNVIQTPSILNIPCQKLTNDKSRVLDSTNILNTPRDLNASLINTNAKLSASPQVHGYHFYSSKYYINDEIKPEEIKRYPYYSKYNEPSPASYIPKLYATNKNFIPTTPNSLPREHSNLSDRLQSFKTFPSSTSSQPGSYQSIPTKVYQPLENILESSNVNINGNPNIIQNVESDFLLYKEKPMTSGVLSDTGRLIPFLIKKKVKKPDTSALPLQPSIEWVRRKPQNIVLTSYEQEGAQATYKSPLKEVICKNEYAVANPNINIFKNLNFIKKVNIPKSSTLKQQPYKNASWFKKYQQNIPEPLPYTKLSYFPKIKPSKKILLQYSYTPSAPIYPRKISKFLHNLMSVTPAPVSSETQPQNNIFAPIASLYVVTPERNQNLHLPKKSHNQYPLEQKFTQLNYIPAVKSSSLTNKPAVSPILLKHSHKQPYKFNKPDTLSRTKFPLTKQYFKPNLMNINQEPVLSKNMFNSLQFKSYILKPSITESFQLTTKNPIQMSLPKYSYKPAKVHDSSREAILQNALLPIPSSLTSTLIILSLPTSYKLSYPKYKIYKPKKVYSPPKQFSLPRDKFKDFLTNEYKSISKSKLNTVPSTSPLTITKIWSPKSKAETLFNNTISPTKQFSLRAKEPIPMKFSKSVLLTQPTFKHSSHLNPHRIPLPSLSSSLQYPYQHTSLNFNSLDTATKVDSIAPIAISHNHKSYLKPSLITFNFHSPYLLPKKVSRNRITPKLSSSSNSLLENSLQFQIPTIQDTVFKGKLDNLQLCSKDNTNNKNHYLNFETLPISDMKAFIPNVKVPNQVYIPFPSKINLKSPNSLITSKSLPLITSTEPSKPDLPCILSSTLAYPLQTSVLPFTPLAQSLSEIRPSQFMSANDQSLNLPTEWKLLKQPTTLPCKYGLISHYPHYECLQTFDIHSSLPNRSIIHNKCKNTLKSLYKNENDLTYLTENQDQVSFNKDVINIQPTFLQVLNAHPHTNYLPSLKTLEIYPSYKPYTSTHTIYPSEALNTAYPLSNDKTRNKKFPLQPNSSFIPFKSPLSYIQPFTKIPSYYQTERQGTSAPITTPSFQSISVKTSPSRQFNTTGILSIPSKWSLSSSLHHPVYKTLSTLDSEIFNPLPNSNKKSTSPLNKFTFTPKTIGKYQSSQPFNSQDRAILNRNNINTQASLTPFTSVASKSIQNPFTPLTSKSKSFNKFKLYPSFKPLNIQTFKTPFLFSNVDITNKHILLQPQPDSSYIKPSERTTIPDYYQTPNKIVNNLNTGKYEKINYIQKKPITKTLLHPNILYNNDNYKTKSVNHQSQTLSPFGNPNTDQRELIMDRDRNLVPIAKILQKIYRHDLGLREIITNNGINGNILSIRTHGTKQIGKEIPLPNISILKYDPREVNNGVEIETDNPDIFIKTWTSKIEVIKPRIVYDKFQVQAYNFEPIVKEVGKYDPNVVEDIVKLYVEKYYGEPIVLKGTYSFYKPYIISNVNNEYLKNGKIYLVWPTLCDCGCKCFGCQCHRKNYK